jgi:hypothetical protein
MKLEDQGVQVLVLDDSLRLAPEPDPEKLRADGLDRELKALRHRLPDLQVALSEPSVVHRQQGFGDVDDYVTRGLEITNANFGNFQLAQRGGRPYPPVDTIDHKKYSGEVAVVGRALSEKHRWVTATEGTVKIGIVVNNLGNLTATDVRLRLYFGLNVLLFEQGGFGAKYNHVLMIGLMTHAPLQTEIGPETDVLYYIGDEDGRPRVDRQRGVAEFTWRRIQQDAYVLSAQCWLVARSETPVGPTALRAEILCEEIGGSREASLPIEVLLPPARE